MRLLRTLTLIYAVVLVLALAVSLIAILVQLLRIDARMREVRTALEEVRDETEPLAERIGQLQEVTAGVSADVTAAESGFAGAADQLTALAEQRGAVEPAR